jgi:chromosome segregation ATPase
MCSLRADLEAANNSLQAKQEKIDQLEGVLQQRETEGEAIYHKLNRCTAALHLQQNANQQREHYLEAAQQDLQVSNCANKHCAPSHGAIGHGLACSTARMGLILAQSISQSRHMTGSLHDA